MAEYEGDPSGMGGDMPGFLDFLRRLGAGHREMQDGGAPIPPMSNDAPGGYAANPTVPPSLPGEMAQAGNSTGMATPDPRERVNDFSKLKPGEQMSWDGLPSTSWGAPKNGQITFEAGMPRMPGTRGPNSTGIDVGDGQGGNYTDPNAPKQAEGDTPGGRWRYLGNDPSKYGGYAAGGEQPVADNAKGVWQWEDDPPKQDGDGSGDGSQVPEKQPFPYITGNQNTSAWRTLARDSSEGYNNMPRTFADTAALKGQSAADVFRAFSPEALQADTKAGQANAMMGAAGAGGSGQIAQAPSSIYDLLISKNPSGGRPAADNLLNRLLNNR